MPDKVTRSTLNNTAIPVPSPLKQFEGRGHSLTIDEGWKDVAKAVLDWLGQWHLNKWTCFQP